MDGFGEAVVVDFLFEELFDDVFVEVLLLFPLLLVDDLWLLVCLFDDDLLLLLVDDFESWSLFDANFTFFSGGAFISPGISLLKL